MIDRGAAVQAAIDAANEAIEARPHRDWPTTVVDTSAWGSPPAKTITVTYERAERDPTPMPQDLPAGWTTIERLQAQLKEQQGRAE